MLSAERKSGTGQAPLTPEQKGELLSQLGDPALNMISVKELLESLPQGKSNDPEAIRRALTLAKEAYRGAGFDHKEKILGAVLSHFGEFSPEEIVSAAGLDQTPRVKKSIFSRR